MRADPTSHLSSLLHEKQRALQTLRLSTLQAVKHELQLQVQLMLAQNASLQAMLLIGMSTSLAHAHAHAQHAHAHAHAHSHGHSCEHLQGGSQVTIPLCGHVHTRERSDDRLRSALGEHHVIQLDELAKELIQSNAELPTLSLGKLRIRDGPHDSPIANEDASVSVLQHGKARLLYALQQR